MFVLIIIGNNLSFSHFQLNIFSFRRCKKGRITLTFIQCESSCVNTAFMTPTWTPSMWEWGEEVLRSYKSKEINPLALLQGNSPKRPNVTDLIAHFCERIILNTKCTFTAQQKHLELRRKDFSRHTLINPINSDVSRLFLDTAVLPSASRGRPRSTTRRGTIVNGQ